MASQLWREESMLTRTSVGLADNDANALTVSPLGRPLYIVVTTVTPEAKWDMISKNWARSILMPYTFGCCRNRIDWGISSPVAHSARAVSSARISSGTG